MRSIATCRPNTRSWYSATSSMSVRSASSELSISASTARATSVIIGRPKRRLTYRHSVVLPVAWLPTK